MSRMRRLVSTGSLLLAAGLLSLVIAEVTVRALGHVDINGQFHLHGYWVRPRVRPLVSLRQALDAYQTSTDLTLEYHPDLGWSPRANARSHDGLYRYNAAGIRAERDYSSRPDSGVVRVLIFGDSFVHGDDVQLAETFVERAAHRVAERSGGAPRVEILNFGVRGYGLDQAFLRFRSQAADFHPHIVVLGFQPENVKRVTNVLRPFYYPLTGLPFSKPRFLLDDGELSLSNVPCLSPGRVFEIIEDPTGWEMRGIEGYYRESDYRDPWWRRSRALSFAADVLEAKLSPPPSPFGVESESARIALRLVDGFAGECEELGADFAVLHLPTYAYLDRWQKHGRFEYQALLDSIAVRHRFIATEDALSQASARELRALFHDYHYNAFGHRVVSEVLAADVVELIASRN